jgi:hypothetical protein
MNNEAASNTSEAGANARTKTITKHQSNMVEAAGIEIVNGRK